MHWSGTFGAALAWAVAFVLLFTGAGAVLSRRFGFPYARLAVPTWIAYLLLGLAVQSALLDVRAATIVVAVAALADAVFGYAMVRRIDPPRGAATSSQLVTGIALAIVSEVAIGFIGASWLFFAIVWLATRYHGAT